MTVLFIHLAVPGSCLPQVGTTPLLLLVSGANPAKNLAEFVAAVKAGDWLSPAVLHIFSSMFLHGGWLHLLGNMLYLWIFGSRLEDHLGRFRFLLLYLVGALTAARRALRLEPYRMIQMESAP